MNGPLGLGGGPLTHLPDIADDGVNDGSAFTVSKTNGQGSTVVPGSVGYESADEILLALADDMTSGKVFGVWIESVADNALGNICLGGAVELTTAEWDAVTDDTGGLTPGDTYYLSAADAGQMTRTAPSTGVVTVVGWAASSTVLFVGIERPIKL